MVFEQYLRQHVRTAGDTASDNGKEGFSPARSLCSDFSCGLKTGEKRGALFLPGDGGAVIGISHRSTLLRATALYLLYCQVQDRACASHWMDSFDAYVL